MKLKQYPILKVKVQSIWQLAGAAYIAIERGAMSETSKERARRWLALEFDCMNDEGSPRAIERFLLEVSDAFTGSGFRPQLSGRLRAAIAAFSRQREAERSAAQAEAERLTREAEQREQRMAEARAKARAARTTIAA